MIFKTIELKANEAGKVAGFFSTYDKTPDSYGDIIEPGAFTETLEKRKATGHPFPLCLNHDFSVVIGACDSIEEKEKGPFVEASLFDTGRAQEVRTWLKSGAIYQFSFAYDVLQRRDPTEEEKKQGIFNKLTKLDLYEVSLVPVPANQTAIVTEIKNDSEVETKDAEVEEKSGRRNSKKDADAIKEAITLLQGVLGELEDIAEPSDEGEDEPKANEASEEQKQSNLESRKTAIEAFIKSMED